MCYRTLEGHSVSMYCPRCCNMIDSRKGADIRCHVCGQLIPYEKSLPWVLASAVLSLIILYIVLNLWNFNIHYPLAYTSDALVNDIYIKTVIENGWYLINNRIGMPFGMTFHEAPCSDVIFFVAVKLMSLFNSNVIVVSNMVHLVTYPLTAGIATIVFMRIGLNAPFAVTASVLYSFMPYHLMRGVVHQDLSYYFMVPVAIFCSLRLFNDKPLFATRYAETRRLSALYASLAILLGMVTEYYVFYSCGFLLIAGVFAGLYHRKITPFISGCILVLIISATFFSSFIPSFKYIARHGRNPHITARSMAESERYALKISQMLLPVRGHRIDSAARLTENSVNTSAIISGEGVKSALGIFGAIGLLSLFVVLLNRSKSYDNGTLLGQLATLNITAVLYGTVGGFSALFALLITPIFRAHARMSIFIAFLSLTCLFAILQSMLTRIPKLYRKSVLLIVASVIMIIGIYDQTNSGIIPDYAAIKIDFDNDADFVRRMEAALPVDSMVFELPFFPFPEHGKVHNLSDYELGKPYLHSNKLKWSYGAMLGRESGEWQKAAVTKPVPEFVREIASARFKGIYIDRRGFADSAREIESQLRSCLHRQPIVSNNGNYLFFPI